MSAEHEDAYYKKFFALRSLKLNKKMQTSRNLAETALNDRTIYEAQIYVEKQK